jgi:hypothetical protein
MLRAWVMGLYLKGGAALQAALAVRDGGERVRSPGKIEAVRRAPSEGTTFLHDESCLPVRSVWRGGSPPLQMS